MPPEVASKLATQAVRAGKSPNLIARDLVTMALERPNNQDQGLGAIHDELAAIRAAVCSQASGEPLRAQIAEIGDALNANEEKRRRSQALVEELIGLFSDWRTKQQQCQDAFTTLPAEFAATRSALSAVGQQQEAMVTLKAEVAKIALDIQQIRKVREDLATIANVLLPNAGKLTPEQAKGWVQKALRGQ